MAQTVKNLPAMQETWVWSPGWEDPLEKEMAIHGQRSLVGYSSQCHKELDTTEQLHTHTQRIQDIKLKKKKIREIRARK